MDRCIQLARNGILSAAPNPMVGAVIVYQDRIIGEGYHVRCGEPHAEVHAIRSVKDPGLLKDATIYVSLEPCSHYGKTPPCADLIIEKQIPRVVVGCLDPFSKVAGRGIQKLRDAGIEVAVGIREKECMELNKRFITFHQKKRPFITLKWAESADRFMDNIRTADQIGGFRFSSPETMVMTHKRRAEHQAILVGGGTAAADNPRLDVRLWGGSNPVRLIYDTHGTLDRELYLLNTPEIPTRIYTTASDWNIPDGSKATKIVLDSNKQAVAQILDNLYQTNIQSLLVEGGSRTLQLFLEENLWDEIFIERSPVTLKHGVRAPHLPENAECLCFSFHSHDYFHYRRFGQE